MSEPLYTVEFAAERLKLHRKTVLRFIRDGRLAATRVGKAYRIRRADLEALAGASSDAAVSRAAPHVTAIVELSDIGPDLARKWAAVIPNALQAKPKGSPPMRADIVYEPDRAALKIIMTGAPRDTSNLLGLIQIWAEQLT